MIALCFAFLLTLGLAWQVTSSHAQPAYAINATVQVGIRTEVSPYSGFGTDTVAGCNAACNIGFGGVMKVIEIISTDENGPNSVYFIRYTPTTGTPIAGECRGQRVYFDMTEQQLQTQQKRRNAIVANPPQ
jgi:hypothetical protein